MVVSSQRSSTQMHNKHCNSSPRQHNEWRKSKKQESDNFSSTLRIVLLHTGSGWLSKLMQDPSVCINLQHTFTTHKRPFSGKELYNLIMLKSTFVWLFLNLINICNPEEISEIQPWKTFPNKEFLLRR